METFQLFLLLFVFLGLALAMFFRKIPALLALPIMAFLIPVISGVSVNDTVQLVLGLGATKLAEAYTIAIFGSMLSIMLQKTGVAENFIKMGAELSGDKPFIITLVMLLLIVLLFTTLGGLGAIIMVSTVVLPILASVGVGPVTIVGIFLFGISIGGLLNVGNWAVYINVLMLTVEEVKSFALILFVVTFLIAMVYITIQLYRDGHNLNFSRILISFFSIVAVCLFFYFSYKWMPSHIQSITLEVISTIGFYLNILIGLSIIALFATSILRIFIHKKDAKLFWGSYFTPIIPLLLILLYNVNFIAAFILGLIYGFISTYKEGSLNTLIKSILEGGAVVMPAVALMLGIGMLLNAVMGPGAALLEKTSYSGGWPVLVLLQPVLTTIIPQNGFSYVFLFGAIAPLALYRGPLNVWGMGYGLAAIFLASGMNPAAIMGLLLSVGVVQGVSDPTNTQNVWLANEVRIDVQKVLWNTIPYSWGIALIGLILAALLFY